MDMLGQTLTLMLLLLLMGHWGQGSTTEHVIYRRSGESLRLQSPNVDQEKVHSAEWKVQWSSDSNTCVLMSWKGNCSLQTKSCLSQHFNDRFNPMCKDLAIVIKAVQQQDSGSYILEVTYKAGHLETTKFQVSALDPVEKPHLQGEWKALDKETCQLDLSCSVSRGENVSYALYKGSQLIQKAKNFTSSVLRKNLTYWMEQNDTNNLHTYTCNVSNPVSWANVNITFPQDCLSIPQSNQDSGFLTLPVIIILILLAVLFLVTLTSFFVWRRKKTQSRKSTEQCLTVYEVINNQHIGRNQEEEQVREQAQTHAQRSPGEAPSVPVSSTIYSSIQPQSSASTSQETANVIYARVEPLRKSGYKKKNHSPSSHCTIYEEVGKKQRASQNPARLSRRELRNFDIYS